MPLRILLPVENQLYCRAALEAVKRRSWPEDSEFLLCKIIEDPTSVGGLVSEPETQQPWQVGEGVEADSCPCTAAFWLEGLLKNPQVDPYKVAEWHNKAIGEEIEETAYESQLWLYNVADDLRSMLKNISTRLVHGNVADQICELPSEWDANYIVIGSCYRNFKARYALGSMASRVLAKSPCSIEVFRLKGIHDDRITSGDNASIEAISSLIEPPERVIVVASMLADIDKTLDWLKSVALGDSLKIRLVSVAQPVEKNLASSLSFGGGVKYRESQRESEETQLQSKNLVAKIQNIYPHASVEERILFSGEPIQAITQEADDWQAHLVLIGLGEHNRDAALDLLSQSACSVIALKDNPATATFSWRHSLEPGLESSEADVRTVVG